VTDPTDRDLIAALRDIVFWGERIECHLAGATEEQFLNSDLLCDAVCFCISCIGEAAARLRRDKPEFAEANPELELTKSAAMRNRIVHGYFAVNQRIVWSAATISVPALVEAARRQLTT